MRPAKENGPAPPEKPKMKDGVIKKGDRWYLQYDLPRSADGKRQLRMVAGGRTRKEAVDKRRTILVELKAGTYIEPDKQTLSAFLPRWLEDCARARVGQRTFHRYEELVRLHIAPAIGAIPIQTLRAPHIQSFYTKALKSGRIDGKGGLSPQTVLHIHRLLHEALEQAARWNLVARNPVDAVDPPKVRRIEMKTWNPDQVQDALEAAEGQWIYTPLLLALGTGMRAGEILGLQWGDLDLARGAAICRRSAAVGSDRAATPIEFKQPKSGKGRGITLPQPLTEALIAHHDAQVKERDLFGLTVTPSDLVIAHPDGSPMRPDVLSRRFRAFLRTAKLPEIRFHDLRHSHATLLLLAGTNPKVVSERLGHSTIVLTLNTYSHVLPSMQDEAARQAGLFLARREGKPIRLEKAG